MCFKVTSWPNFKDHSLVVPVKEKPIVPVIVYVYHSVRRGEGLGIIAAKYNITVNEILTSNNMKSTVLFTGQRLKIPQKVINEVLKIEESIKEEISADSVKVTKTVVPAKKPKQTVPVKKFYEVKVGDTGIKIAQKYNLTQQQLINLNPGINLQVINVGQQIRVK